MFSKENFLRGAEFLFLAAVALLIIRNNSYPWPVKRASDILFLLSALIACYFIFRFKEGYKNFFERKNILIALALISLGLIVASLNGYFSDGLTFTKEGMLTVGRFAEVFVILFLISFFQSFDVHFYKKAAFAQLSTLAYLPVPVLVLLSSQSTRNAFLTRFQLWENWPSNVGYYLVVSLTLLVVWLLNFSEFTGRYLIYYAGAVGLFSILIWTESRASWLGLFTGFILLMTFFFLKEKGKLFLNSLGDLLKRSVIILSLIAVGFLVLPTPVKNGTIQKIYPSINEYIPRQDILNSSPFDLFNTIKTQRLAPKTDDQRRSFLWLLYSKEVIHSPLGLGVNYNPSKITGDLPQGPHNTLLEYLVLAGPLGLGGFSWLLYLCFKNLRNNSGKIGLWGFYVAASLTGLLVASLFDNMATFRLMWLLIGISLSV